LREWWRLCQRSFVIDVVNALPMPIDHLHKFMEVPETAAGILGINLGCCLFFEQSSDRIVTDGIVYHLLYCEDLLILLANTYSLLVPIENSYRGGEFYGDIPFHVATKADGTPGRGDDYSPPRYHCLFGIKPTQ
jgi:hypothetical protein